VTVARSGEKLVCANGVELCLETFGAPTGGAALREIAAPMLVVQGTAAPMFPLAHGEALAREIPNERLLPVEGMGHGYPPEWAWDAVVPALLALTAERQ